MIGDVIWVFSSAGVIDDAQLAQSAAEIAPRAGGRMKDYAGLFTHSAFLVLSPVF